MDKIFKILTGCLLLVSFNLKAQQTPVFSQYNINKFLLNPAVAGGNNYTTLNMVAREQFVGFKNPPRTFALTAQTRLLNDSYIMKRLQIKHKANQKSRMANIGLGGTLFSDRNGIVTKTGIQLAYSYHVNFNNEYQLSLGLSGSAYQFKLDDSDSYIADPGDQLLSGNDKQFWIPDATIGIYITNNTIYAGAAMSDLFGSSLKLGVDPVLDDYRTARNYNLMAGYRIPLEESGFLLEPSILVWATKHNFLTDINTRLFYNDEYWFGLSYRSNNTIIVMTGIRYEMFYFGYSYDASLGLIRNYNSGSHEIMLGIRFGDNNTRRFRWLKKDDVEFDI